jgi:hypothetical protein
MLVLGRLRSRSGVRTAVCLAALLSLAGSVGLHPEPVGSPIRDAQLGFTATAEHGAIRTALHLCHVCALYFACSLAPAASVAPVTLRAGATILPSWSSFSGRTERRQHEGRDPPLAS